MPSQYDAQRARANSLKRYFGITIEQYDELLTNQNGCCAICERPAEAFKVRLAVDHDHHSGELRGLLCSVCNHRIVGKYHSLKDAELLRRVADYICQGTGLFVPEAYLKRRRKTTQKRTK